MSKSCTTPTQSTGAVCAPPRSGLELRFHLVEQDARRHGEVERGGFAVHRQAQHPLAGRGLLFGETLALAAQQQDGRALILGFLVVGIAVSGGAVDAVAVFPRPGRELLETGIHDRLPEQCPHAGAHRGRVMDIHAVIQDDQAVRAGRVERAQDRAEVAGVLRAGQGDAPGEGHRGQAGERGQAVAHHRQDALRVVFVGQAA